MLKAWRISESEIYAAESLDQAVELAMKTTGLCRDDVLDDDYAREESLTLTFENEEGQRWTLGECLSGFIEPGLLVAFEV